MQTISGRRGRALPLVVTALFSVACGSNPSTTTTFAGDEIHAPEPGAETYATASTAGPSIEGAEAPVAAVRRGLERAVAEREMALEPDARLSRLARWIAAHAGPNGALPPQAVVDFFARHLGLVEPQPHLIVLGQPVDELEEGVSSALAPLLGRQAYNRYGAFVDDRDGLPVVVLVLTWRWVDLEPIRREQSSGTPVAVRGRLVGEYENPVVAVATPAGRVQRYPAGAGPGFDVRVPLAEPGPHQVELLARGPRGDTVIANFPVYVDQSPPVSIRLSARSGELVAARDVEGVKRALLTELNRTRQAAGLGSLSSHAQLAEIALAHSRDMVENDFVGHTSPRTGTPAERVRGAGLSSGLILENIGRGYEAREIHEGLMESPGHRANLINPDVTHVGIGVVAQPEAGRTAYVVTQVFVRMASRVDLSDAPARVLEQLNRARSARGAPPLTLEGPLTEAASQAVARFFAEPDLTQDDVVEEASAGLRRFAIAYRRLGGVMAIVARVDDAGALEPALDPDIRYVGIGVAQGTRPDTEENAIAVVLVLAWPR